MLLISILIAVGLHFVVNMGRVKCLEVGEQFCAQATFEKRDAFLQSPRKAKVHAKSHEVGDDGNDQV